MVIRRVLLDAFGTIFSPREPVHAQYARIGRSYGLPVADDDVKSAFKKAFKQWAASHPLYGKQSRPPLDPTDWWRSVIVDTFRFSGVAPSQLNPVSARLSEELVQRFWGTEGYALHEDFEPFLRGLHAMPEPRAAGSSRSDSPPRSRLFPPPVVVSNTDPALLKILDSLGVSETGFEPPQAGVQHAQVYTTWHLEEDKKDVRFWEEVLRRLRLSDAAEENEGQAELLPSEVLVVGDELVSDYETPRRAGFRTLLLRRDTPNGEHARASYEDEKDGLADVETVKDLIEVLDKIRHENSRRPTSS